ncbi:MAG: glycosyltransferase family 4 protein, partial [Rhodocyclaceae bacterium]|nr:glycosyltransferase family 4 protein [Rhodocyclaceae bacterium]
MTTSRTRLLIVAPYRDEPDFLDTLGDRLTADIRLMHYTAARAVSDSLWRRHLLIFGMAWRAFRASRRYDLVLFGEQFVGLYYALFTRLLFWLPRAPAAAVLQLIYNRKRGLAGALYRAAYRWLIGAPALSWLVCHASLERNYYLGEFGAAAGRKIHFVAYGRSTPKSPEELPGALPEAYFFAGGTSNRDYATLVEAFRGLSVRLVIACHPADLAGLELPPNVKAVHGAYGERFNDLLEGARAVVLPIRETGVSAGQLVLIDAMRAGKACVVTSGSCMEDYVDDACAVRVPARDAASLRAAVHFLATNPAARERLGAAARLRYMRDFTRRAFAERL